MTEKNSIRVPQWQVAAEWFERANGDLRIARTTVDLHADTLWGAAMHCQQALEKLAKGLLIAYGIRPPRTHDIEVLADLVERHHPAFGDRIRDLDGLTAWYFAARYPSGVDGLLPALSEVRVTIDQLETLRLDIASLAPKSGE